MAQCAANYQNLQPIHLTNFRATDQLGLKFIFKIDFSIYIGPPFIDSSLQKEGAKSISLSTP
jgi:hypothetical protein